MKKTNLNSAWHCECIGRFTASTEVPTCTINNLIENGYLPKDLLVGKNADAVKEFENDDWVYTKSFNLSEVSAKSFLRFNRIDTYADVYFNGKILAHVENGNIEHRFDVSDLVKCGENTLKVCLFSPIKAADGMPKRNGAFTTERLYTRRTQCTYGWDWTARFVSCGIGDVELITYDEDEPIVRDVYIFTEKIESDAAAVAVEASLEKEVCRPISFEILSPLKKTVFKEEICRGGAFYKVCADIEDAELWYPVGYGKQPLYTLRLKDGEEIIYEEKF